MTTSDFSIKGHLVDFWKKNIYPAEIHIINNKINAIRELPQMKGADLPYILPGFIDSHVHIESSMLIPSEFARLAVVHGTVATVSDPHEIANVCGIEGIDFMIENGNKVPFKFNFGAPSCVPATNFETAGAAINSDEIKQLLQRPDIKYLSEMMNFPGVLMHEEEVMKKIEAAKQSGKPVDGHAPGLMGETAKKYIQAGISTDHECFTKEEALDKLKYGMKILIREGSAAKNFEALIDLLHDYPDKIMFCSDDKHPDSLVAGHIDQLCARAVKKGIDLYKIIQAACINPVLHYGLDVGLLREGDSADFILVRDLIGFQVLETYINGALLAKEGKSLIPSIPSKTVNRFECVPIHENAIKFYSKEFSGPADGTIPVIEALDGQLITNKLWLKPRSVGDEWVSDPENDLLKMVVINRYQQAPVAKAFIKNFGLKRAAIASSVAHDSHNIIAIGADDASLVKAINMIINAQGGISCVDDTKMEVLPLPVAGLMSVNDGYTVANAYTKIDQMAKDLGSALSAPFMTLSFMALLVIPHLKLSDKGLFDGDKFRLI